METPTRPTTHILVPRGRLFVTALCVLLASGLMWGLASALASDSTPSPSAAKVVLKVGVVDDPDNLNPFIGWGPSSYEVWSLNYDMLIGYAADGSPAPQAAESWDVSPDGKVWTFHIREGMTWQDGEPFTAKDVAFTYNYIIANELSAFSTQMKLIEEARLVDDYTVQLICSKPKANMERLYLYILPEHIWSKVSPKAAETSFENEPPVIGSGPFQCVEYKQDEYVRMVANKDYWRAAPQIDEIFFVNYTNADSMVMDLKSGGLDAAVGIPPAQFPSVEAETSLEAIPFASLYFEYLCFNCYADVASQGHPVLRDVDFRRALAWAVDLEKCVELGWDGYSEPGTTIVAPGQWPADFDAHYEPTAEEEFGFDIDQANQLLDEAGYEDADGDGLREYEGEPIELRLVARTDSPSSQRQGKLMTGWFSQLGLKINYQVMDEGALSDAIYSTTDGGNTYAPDFDMYLWAWIGYADPGDTMGCFTTEQIWMWNEACWSNKEYDALADQQYSEIDREARLDQLHRMQQIFYDEEPMRIVGYPKTLEAVNTEKWEGWVPYMGGSVFMNTYNMDSYIYVHPRATAAEEQSSSSWWIAALIAAAAGGVALVVWLVRRGRVRAIEG